MMAGAANDSYRLSISAIRERRKKTLELAKIVERDE